MIRTRAFKSLGERILIKVWGILCVFIKFFYSVCGKLSWVVLEVLLQVYFSSHQILISKAQVCSLQSGCEVFPEQK